MNSWWHTRAFWLTIPPVHVICWIFRWPKKEIKPTRKSNVCFASANYYPLYTFRVYECVCVASTWVSSFHFTDFVLERLTSDFAFPIWNGVKCVLSLSLLLIFWVFFFLCFFLWCVFYFIFLWWVGFNKINKDLLDCHLIYPKKISVWIILIHKFISIMAYWNWLTDKKNYGSGSHKLIDDKIHQKKINSLWMLDSRARSYTHTYAYAQNKVIYKNVADTFIFIFIFIFCLQWNH